MSDRDVFGGVYEACPLCKRPTPRSAPPPAAHPETTPAAVVWHEEEP